MNQEHHAREHESDATGYEKVSTTISCLITRFQLRSPWSLIHFYRSFRRVRDYRMLPSWGVKYAGFTLIAIEGLIAFSYLSGRLLWPAGILALGLLGSFLVVTSVALRRGMNVRCLCFGATDAESLSVRTIVRISLLAVALLALLSQSSERDGWVGPEYSGRDAVSALMTAVLIQILTSWALAISEVARLIKGCRGCARRDNQLRVDAGRRDDYCRRVTP